MPIGLVGVEEADLHAVKLNPFATAMLSELGILGAGAG